MKRMALFVALSSVIGLAGAAPAVAASSRVDRLYDIETVLATRIGDDFPIRSLMRADCDVAQFVRLPDGRGIETLHCQLSDRPVMIPEFQGVPPSRAFTVDGGPCEWTSDYWYAKDGSIVQASSYHYSVNPSGEIHVTALYAAEPAPCG